MLTPTMAPLTADQPCSAAEPADLIAPFRAEAQRALATDWLRWLAEQVDLHQLAADTVATYRRGLGAWLIFLDSVARTDRPTPATVAAYLTALLPGRQPASVNLRLHVLRSLYRWAESGDRYPNIARSARAVRVCRDGPLPCLAHAQVAGLVAGVVGDDLGALRDRALITTLYGSACRTVSLARATVGDLDLAARTLRHQQKGRRSADSVAYLPAGTVTALVAYLAARGQGASILPTQPLFIALDHRSRGGPLSTCSMRGIIRREMERAGHARRGPDGRLLSPGIFSAHSLRRSALTTAADAHGLEAARVVAGHSSVEITRRAYVRAKADAQMRVVAQVLDLRLD